MRKLIVLLAIALMSPSMLAAQERFRPTSVPLAAMTHDQRAAIILTAKAPASENCATIADPAAPPAISLLDKEPLQAILDAHKSTHPGKYIVYAVRVGPKGEKSTRLVEATMPADEVAQIDSVIGGAIVWRPNPHGVSFQLRLEPGAADSVRVAPSIICPPAILDQRTLQQKISRLADRFRNYSRAEATITFFIDENGKATSFEIARSSGDPAYDNAAGEYVGPLIRFRPQTMDGFPVKTQVKIPVIITNQ